MISSWKEALWQLRIIGWARNNTASPSVLSLAWDVNASQERQLKTQYNSPVTSQGKHKVTCYLDVLCAIRHQWFVLFPLLSCHSFINFNYSVYALWIMTFGSFASRHICFILSDSLRPPLSRTVWTYLCILIYLSWFRCVELLETKLISICLHRYVRTSWTIYLDMFIDRSVMNNRLILFSPSLLETFSYYVIN